MTIMTHNLMKASVWALVWAAATALAQTYPDKPIRVLAAQSAGSSLDTIARIVTIKMSELLGQQLVIDNRGGRGRRRGAVADRSRSIGDGTDQGGAPESAGAIVQAAFAADAGFADHRRGRGARLRVHELARSVRAERHATQR